MNEVILITNLFVTILFSQYAYIKVLNYKDISIVKYVICLIFSLILAYSIYLLREPLPYLRFAIMVLFIAFFLSVILKTEITVALTSSIVSTGISYGASLISVMISVSLALPIPGESYYFVAVATIVLQCILIICLFKIKRFKKGVTFLKSNKASAIGLVISGFLLLLFVLINRGVPAERGGWIIVGIALCVTGLFVWWRRGLTRQYRERVNERNKQEFEKIVAGKEQKIEKLQEDNDLMASIIHRDNKLLPAMAEKVILFMRSESNVSPEGNQIIKQVEQLFEERKEVLKRCSYSSTDALSLKNPLIDGVLNHMMMRASEEGIQFEIAEISNFAESVETIISTIKLQTILADLIENAINATVKCKTGRVFVSFSVEEGVYKLRVQDSGKPFEAETLINLGIKKTTTRSEEGGSGIGYMAIFEILRECNASLTITEYGPGKSLFAKSITVSFDNEGKYLLLTDRAEVIRDMYIEIERPEDSLKILPI